jgi:membrane fusion protein, heavy metal efflux system
MAIHKITSSPVSASDLGRSMAILAQFGYSSWRLLPVWILLGASSALAHAGHGNEFSHRDGTTNSNVQIDRATAARIGVKVVPAKTQSLHVEIAATGQIELLPSKKVEVTAPIRGKRVQLLVQPGAKVKAARRKLAINANNRSPRRRSNRLKPNYN